MAERKIDPKFNIHESYKKMNIVNPYRYGSGEVSEFTSIYPFNETKDQAIDIVSGWNSEAVYNVDRDGESYTFKGATAYSYVRIADNPDHSFAGRPFSIELDINFSSFKDCFLISKREDSNLNCEYQLDIINNEVRFLIFENGSNTNMRVTFPVSEISTGVDYTLKIEYDNSNLRTGMKILVDGVRKDSAAAGVSSISGMADTTMSTLIGTSNWSLSHYSLDAKIYEIRIV